MKTTPDRAAPRGERGRFAHQGQSPCLIPPDGSGGYTSIFSLQQKETEAVARGSAQGAVTT